jgi:hypothetical protein
MEAVRLRLPRPGSNLTVIGLIALFLYGFIRSVLLKPLAIAGLAARKFSCGGFLRPHQC